MSIRRAKKRPIIALVGRTNVGKSTLWNKLGETGRAIVSPDAHTTRDRNYDTVVWKGSVFDVIDTGGMDVEKDEIGAGILSQAEHAIREADLVLFLVDVKTGLLPQDKMLARKTRALNKHVWLVANKTDKADALAYAYGKDMYQLGLGDPHPVSAATSLGIGDLLDELLIELERLGKPAVPAEELQPLRIVIIGRPNVGKSSLVNAILGEPRVIVSKIAHTTREPQDTWLRYQERDIVLVDTAGMRKRSKIQAGIEDAAIQRNESAIRQADVSLLVFDATEPPSSQDRFLGGHLEETSKGVVLVANKWDLVKDKLTGTATEFERLIRFSFPFLDWAPLVFVSATKDQRTVKLLDYAIRIQDERMRHIDYNALNRVMKSCIKAKKPLQSYGPKSPRIYDVAQVGYSPPTFLVTVIGERENIHPSWLKFFEKRLRQKFGYEGTPIVVKARNVPPSKSRHKRNVSGPGMEAVAGKIKEKPRKVNQTRRRQKHGGHRY